VDADDGGKRYGRECRNSVIVNAGSVLLMREMRIAHVVRMPRAIFREIVHGMKEA